jgi:anti-anti-sigma factor
MPTTTAIRQVGSVTIVDISGNIVFGKDLASLRNLVSDLRNQGHKQVLLNLRDVDHFDSSGMGFLVSALIKRAQGWWRTEAAQPHTKGAGCNEVYKTICDFRHSGR